MLATLGVGDRFASALKVTVPLVVRRDGVAVIQNPWPTVTPVQFPNNVTLTDAVALDALSDMLLLLTPTEQGPASVTVKVAPELSRRCAIWGN